jgi:IS30 family transposase
MSQGIEKGDLIIGDQYKSALSVIIERKIRYVMIDRLLSYDAATVRKSLERRWGKLDPAVVKNLTCDQGKEMAQHEALAKRVKMEIYFCHPHPPWGKGTCENTNYLIRDMFEGARIFGY